MREFFHAFFYEPLYNGFIFFIDIFPWFDAGVVIVLFTIIIKLILFPLSRRATIAQLEIKKLEPEMSRIKEKYKDDKQEQARQTMALYKDKKINPFSSILPVLIQLPIIFALYFIFLKAGLPKVDETLLYSFVSKPENINMEFLGFINITAKSLFLALLAGVSSFFQIRLSMPAYVEKKDGVRSFSTDLAKSMNMQMRYVFPVIVFFIAYSISAVVALYWLTSNVFTIVQDFIIRKRFNPSSTTNH
jgi:YidC/Oxa1 family membrane protein insertase